MVWYRLFSSLQDGFLVLSLFWCGENRRAKWRIMFFLFCFYCVVKVFLWHSCSWRASGNRVSASCLQLVADFRRWCDVPLADSGTACSAPLAWLNREKAPVDLLLMISDNESWADVARGDKSAMLAEWDKIKQRNPQAKLVCLDIQPYATVQARNRHDILNIGGFSDQVFHLLGAFAAQNHSADFWVESIEKIRIAEKAA